MALLTLDHDEAEIARAALRRFRDEMVWRCDKDRVMRVTGAAWAACIWIAQPRIEALIERIEQWQKDEENGDGC